MTYTASIETPLGAVTAAAENEALIGLWFIGQKHYPVGTADWVGEPDRPIFQALRRHLDAYFAGKASPLDIRLAPAGSPFQRTVWDVLMKIPQGRVVTYGQIARFIAGGGGAAAVSARAVGSAVGRNPISILIPCHRVVAADGSLTGYAGGLAKKAALLRLEGANPAEVDCNGPDWPLACAAQR